VGKKTQNRKVLMNELSSRKYARRSMYTKKIIKKNEILSDENIIPKRPGIGISPMFAQKLYGKKARHNIPEDTLLKWKHTKN